MADSFELQIVNPVESRELRVEWLRARCNVYTSNRTILEINVTGASTGLNRDTVDLSLVSRGYFHSLVASSCCSLMIIKRIVRA